MTEKRNWNYSKKMLKPFVGLDFMINRGILINQRKSKFDCLNNPERYCLNRYIRDTILETNSLEPEGDLRVAETAR